MQHGLPEFKIANLFEDMQILKSVQSLAMKILNDDPNLEKEENKLLKNLIKDKFMKRIETVSYTHLKKFKISLYGRK